MRNAIIAIVLVVILAVGGYFLVKRYGAPSVSSDSAAPNADAASSTPVGVTVGEEIAPENLAAEVKEKSVPQPSVSVADENEIIKGKFAASFVERFGTYSVDANFSNLRELTSLMTPTLRKWAQGIIDANKLPPAGYRIRAVALATQPKKGTTNVYMVTTQKEETSNGTTRRFYQKATITLAQSGSDWLVDSVVWGEEGAL